MAVLFNELIFMVKLTDMYVYINYIYEYTYVWSWADIFMHSFSFPLNYFFRIGSKKWDFWMKM